MPCPLDVENENLSPVEPKQNKNLNVNYGTEGLEHFK
jgi:hypothetical protein